MNRFFKSAAFPIIVVIVLAYVAQSVMFGGSKSSTQKKTWSDMTSALAAGQVKELKQSVSANSVKVTLNDQNSKPYTVGIPGDEAWNQVYSTYSKDKNITIEGTKVGGTNWASLLFGILPFLLFLGFWLFLMNQVQGGGSKVMSFG